jgi:glycosyltransferase involved in cell wall biosynthesis
MHGTDDDEPIYIDVLTTRFAGGPAIENFNEFVTIHRVDVPVMDALDWYNSVVDNNSVFVDYGKLLGKTRTYDLIHVHDWLTGEAGITLKHYWKTPLVVTIHATERGRHQGWLPTSTSQQIDHLEWRIAYEAWRVVACSEYMRDELARWFALPAEKITVIPNGIDTSQIRICPAPELEAMRLRYAPNGERLLFYVGRIVHEKGVHLIVRAMPRILANHPNTRLLVAGKNGQKLFPLAYELGVEKEIDFLGYIDDATRDCLYQIVDAAIFPSLYEPFGIVALEAMANDCNVIASNTGGLGEVVQHEATGLTVIAGDPMSIVWAVDRLFNDAEAAAARREAALAEVDSKYRWDQIGAQTRALYAQVAAARQGVEW